MWEGTDVADMHANGIEVDDEYPAPENAVEYPPAAGQEVGEWVRQTICPCRALGVANMPTVIAGA